MFEILLFCEMRQCCSRRCLTLTKSSKIKTIHKSVVGIHQNNISDSSTCVASSSDCSRARTVHKCTLSLEMCSPTCHNIQATLHKSYAFSCIVMSIHNCVVCFMRPHCQDYKDFDGFIHTTCVFQCRPTLSCSCSFSSTSCSSRRST